MLISTIMIPCQLVFSSMFSNALSKSGLHLNYAWLPQKNDMPIDLVTIDRNHKMKFGIDFVS